ncbi:MAG TPA: ABC transporter ATP-binding protein [Anaerovoracaceae bacterium]|nr:ABC transporter ATP-binding protein [Anaerovoracaceae bacterium]
MMKKDNNDIMNIIGLHKSFMIFKEELMVLKDVHISIKSGEILGILGPSGCGKSTLLNIAGGFLEKDSGQVLFKGKEIEGPSSDKGVVFQNTVLFPWLTVKENILYGLKLKKTNKDIMEKKFEKIIDLIGLKGFEEYYPNQMSGGMQQRASLARVLIMQPEIILMDEPFGALDAYSRMIMQKLLLDLSLKLELTILFITHDIEEALILSDRIHIMDRRPSSIIKEIIVPYDRYRDYSIVGDEGFVKLKKDILNLLFNNEH